ncbi:MAG: preprotein translocase subunit SecG [Akkermansiaceae bacterium]|jgi:preprotein translocase subunit SecG|nr:preprotein translocase subunit SecG [Akkermansiaceae bacterium]MDP4646754.1 preprotein translocase subunit SecG [Akkermansiaceae bacterium]MDP4720657.1 preprotein translocase subunit SecG [Akkermansiaceae bacterium]MDP4779671.1 preprotein translocase subunit SecG [Akkermansiaceae bacterium]MDP4846671.1 preprotein translocase subunit SecG [Akkermansiaceae bacterium]
MIFAAINWLDISINLLLVVFVIVCLLMSLLILMQRPKQEGLGAAFGGGVTDQVFGARTTNVLQKGTVYLGSLFFIISLTLAILIGKQSQQKSLLDPKKTEVVEEKAAEEEAEVIPASLEDELTVEDITKEISGATDEAVETVEEVLETPVESAPTEESAPAEENKADKPE